jgi:p-hydroxybenzoate 3-monooxygenase
MRGRSSIAACTWLTGAHHVDMQELAGGKRVTVRAVRGDPRPGEGAARCGGAIEFGASEVRVLEGGAGSVPAGGEVPAPRLQFVAGCDGSHGVAPFNPGGHSHASRTRHPFGWFGILVEAPPSSES